VNKNEIVWAQNQYFKLYRDGTLYAVKDRYEKTPLKVGANIKADEARQLLQSAIESMPKKAVKLSGGKK
jgi:hypothetical protein